MQLMPLGPTRGIAAGAPVWGVDEAAVVSVGPHLLGRVIDGRGLYSPGGLSGFSTQLRIHGRYSERFGGLVRVEESSQFRAQGFQQCGVFFGQHRRLGSIIHGGAA